jgi:hypothetical protein
MEEWGGVIVISKCRETQHRAKCSETVELMAASNGFQTCYLGIEITFQSSPGVCVLAVELEEKGLIRQISTLL